MKNVINSLVRDFTNNLVAEIRAHVLDVIKEKGTKFSAPRSRKPGKPRSEEQMRCRHSHNGHRCKARSKGPRFFFLCQEHLDSKPSKKAAAPKKPATAKKKPAAKQVKKPTPMNGVSVTPPQAEAQA